METFKLLYTDKPFVPDVPTIQLPTDFAHVGVIFQLPITEFPDGPFKPPVVNLYSVRVVEVRLKFSQADHNGVVFDDTTEKTLILASMMEALRFA